MSVDKQALVVWLRDRSKHRNSLVGSVYQGLADRVQRGDFDEDKEVEDDGLVQGR